MTPGTLEAIIRKYIGNIGNTPSTNNAIEQLAFNLYTNPGIMTKPQVLFAIEVEFPNIHKRTDLAAMYPKLADELVEAMEKV